MKKGEADGATRPEGAGQTLFEQIFVFSATAAALLDDDGTVIRSNRAFERLFRDLPKARHAPEQAMRPQERQAFVQFRRAVLEGGITGPQAGREVHLGTGDTATIHGWASLVRLDTEGEGGPRLLIEIRELTGDRALENRLEQSEQRFRQFAESAADWFWETDEEHRYTWFSRRVEDFIDFPREWHYGRSRVELGQPTEPDPAWDAHLKQLEAREPFRDVTFHRIAPDGERWIRSSGVPVFDDDGRFRGYRGSGTDITELVRARQAVTAVQSRLADAVNSVPEGMLIFDADDRLILCNDHFHERSPWLADLLVPGTPYRAILERVAGAGLLEELSAAEREDWLRTRLRLDSQPQPAMEFRIRDGTWARIIDRRIETGGRVVLRMDITDLKHRQLELEQQRNRSEIANRAKTEFLGNMSHELRTPLNAIIGFADVMVEGLFGPIPERYQSYARDIAISGRHLLDLISDLLDLARIEAGQLKIDRRRFLLGEAIGECLRQVRFAAMAKRLELAVHLTAEEAQAVVFADPRAFRQILLNLLSNAVKFSPDGAQIDIAAGGVAPVLELTVRDQGEGIDEADLERIFDRFVQVEGAMNRKHEGAGIGLSLSRSLAELHGGSLSLQSRSGEGTVARLLLPNPGAEDPARTSEPERR